LTMASIVLAIVFKQSSSDPITVDGPHSHLRKAPQWILIIGVLAFAIYVFQDGLQFNRLTGLYPMVASVSTMAFLAPIIFFMLTKKEPSQHFYDEELKRVDEGGRSAEYYIGMLAVMLLFSGVVGFVLGVATFIAAFLWRGAGLVWWKAILGGCGFVLFLGILSDQLTLRYPAGLLQSVVTLPWPLQ
ncbi:MAG: hypothetical protein AAF580_08730, partial [Pseudomonadota bacterium]